MTKRYDVTALGEVLIDFTENGSSAQGNPMYEANPGGAPCNVLAMLQKLGHKTAFLGKVGEDIFGRRLEKVLKETGIDTAGLCTDPAVRTTLAFVEKKADGDRDFSFYRNPGADMMLRAEELREQILKDTRIFHFGTLSMTDEPVRSATRHAIETAKANGALLSFDPNIREPLWQSMEEAKRQTAYGMEVCDVLKISDNEIRWFTGEEDFDREWTCFGGNTTFLRFCCRWEAGEAGHTAAAAEQNNLHFYRKVRSRRPEREIRLAHAACTIFWSTAWQDLARRNWKRCCVLQMRRHQSSRHDAERCA